ncbi:hypothetical protein V3331_05655 [Gaopeijia maritima]|uniref:hypothetical protein n=1 Tax=Gaopeijia maritima TaxID=3119007 RepID=UPI0032524F88
MLFQRMELQNPETLDRLFPPDQSDEEWRARLAAIRGRYLRGRAGQAVFALVAAVLIAITFPPFSTLQVLGIIAVGVVFLVTRSTGDARLANLERRVEYMIEQRRDPRRRDDQPSS